MGVFRLDGTVIMSASEMKKATAWVAWGCDGSFLDGLPEALYFSSASLLGLLYCSIALQTDPRWKDQATAVQASIQKQRPRVGQPVQIGSQVVQRLVQSASGLGIEGPCWQP